MTIKCKQCDKEFEAKRETAKYCSDKCRKLAFQVDAKVSVPRVSVPKSVTDNNFKVIEEKDMKGGDMYFCSTHGEHCKNYCEAMCDNDCNHILKDE